MAHTAASSCRQIQQRHLLVTSAWVLPALDSCSRTATSAGSRSPSYPLCPSPSMKVSTNTQQRPHLIQPPQQGRTPFPCIWHCASHTVTKPLWRCMRNYHIHLIWNLAPNLFCFFWSVLECPISVFRRAWTTKYGERGTRSRRRSQCNPRRAILKISNRLRLDQQLPTLCRIRRPGTPLPRPPVLSKEVFIQRDVVIPCLTFSFSSPTPYES